MRNVLVGCLVAACSSCGAPSGGGTHTSSITTAAETTSSDASGDSTADAPKVDAGSEECERGCTTDLRGVIECDGSVTSCADDEACVGGACSDDPCGAAERAQTSVGCEFLPIKVDISDNGTGACFAMFVANTWPEPVHLEVEYDGVTLPVAEFVKIPQGQGPSLTYTDYDPQAGLGVGEIAIVMLSRGEGALPQCPFAPALAQEVGFAGTGRGKAFTLRTDRPVVAYQMLPFGGGETAVTSATLLLPRPAWGTAYVAVNAYRASELIERGFPSLDVIAAESTEVRITPVQAIEAGGDIPATAAGETLAVELAGRTYLQITQREELTGSIVEADAPIGVIGASPCFHAPTDVLGCDSGQQQLLPIRATGSRYVGVRHRDRTGATDESPPWRLVGLVDDTTLIWEPSAPPGAPSQLQRGEVAEFSTAAPFVVASQDSDHPFYLAGYMLGGEPYDGEGDPDWHNVVPVEQYLESYVFFTDPTYPETSLVVVRRRDEGNEIGQNEFAQVSLDCRGTLDGWQPVGEFEYTRVDLVTGNFEGVQGCGNGRHSIVSDAPFSVIVWGWGSPRSEPTTRWVSYAYPAGLGVKPVNDVVPAG